MTKLLNEPDRFQDDLLEGFLAAYSRYVRRVAGASGVIARDAPRAGKVAVLIGGGSGHYPAFCGYVGRGMADVAVVGNVFTSPSGEQVYRCTKAADGGAGVLYSYGNYSGDVLNFNVAQKRCRAEGIDVRTVTVTDDVASAPPDQIDRRRGIAGDFFVFKVAGASAARGDSLNDVEEFTRRANDRTRSLGVAFAGCTLPGQHKPLFTVELGRMELGLGVHGEMGTRSSEMLPAREIARLMVETLVENAPEGAGEQVAILLNGLGSTKYEELFVLYRDIHTQLEGAGLRPFEPNIGEFVTSLDMAGCSLTLFWLDDVLRPLLEAPADTPAYSRG